MPRCFWCTADPLYIEYHDHEWGVPQRDPAVLFEFLLLEGFQAGLSWITVLKKRERYRQVLHGFDPRRLAQLSDAEIAVLEREVSDLQESLATRKSVERAKSVLQEKLGLSEPDAFRWIQKTAMDLRLSMKQVADGVVEHGVAGLGADGPS